MKNGQIVTCKKCGKLATVRTIKPGKIALTTEDTLRGTALKCQDCGYILCTDCAFSLDPMIPICPKCNSKGGPSFFPE